MAIARERISPALVWAAATLVVSVVVGAAVASPRAHTFVLLTAVVVAVAFALFVPPHLFIAASVIGLGISAAFESNPYAIGSISIYAFDIVLALLIIRALSPRERADTETRLMVPAVAVPYALWAAVMLWAGYRGHTAGNSLGRVARLEMPLVYLSLFTWGFMRTLREPSLSVPRLWRSLTLTCIAFIGYALFARITHQRFEPPAGTGIGAVVTSSGILRRDYGLFSAFELYPLLALAAISYRLFSERASKSASVVAVIGIAATLLTLVRGFIFGAAAAVVVMLVVAYRERWTPVGRRFLVPVAILALAFVPFALYSPAAAKGVLERALPGIVAQTQTADATVQYRQQVLNAGETLANNHPFGIGFVDPVTMSNDGFPLLYVAHSQWAALLALTGWPGALLFAWLGFAIVRRSAKLEASERWLHPLLIGAAVLMAVQAFGWDALFTISSALGFFALIVALRFGLSRSVRT